MKLIDKLLRLPLAPEVLALLEKIDSIDSIYDASYLPIQKLLDDRGFTAYERKILKKALSKISRRHAYSCAMHVVIKNELPEKPSKSGILTRGAMIQAAQHEFNKAYLQTQPIVSVHSTALKPTNPYELYRQDDNHRF